MPAGLKHALLNAVKRPSLCGIQEISPISSRLDQFGAQLAELFAWSKEVVLNAKIAFRRLRQRRHARLFSNIRIYFRFQMARRAFVEGMVHHQVLDAESRLFPLFQIVEDSP